jgi:hypothetical protein
VLDRHVVATEAPRPGGGAGLAEDPQPVQLGITPALATPVDAPALELVEDVLQCP